MRQTLPFAAPGSRDQHGTVRAHAAILCKCTAHARDLLQPSQLLPNECALPVRSSYCHRDAIFPIRSMRGIATCLTKVLRRPARCTSPDDLAASLGRIGCLGVLAAWAYCVCQRTRFDAGRRCCSAFLACVVPSGMTWLRSCRFMLRANGYGHVACPLRRDSAETLLVRCEGWQGADDGIQTLRVYCATNNRFASDLGIQYMVARSSGSIASYPLFCLCMTLTYLTPDLSRDSRPHAVHAKRAVTVLISLLLHAAAVHTATPA